MGVEGVVSMKRAVAVPLFIAALLLLPACGSEVASSAAPAARSSPTQTQAPSEAVADRPATNWNSPVADGIDVTLIRSGFRRP